MASADRTASDLVVGLDDPRADDVRALVEAHAEFARLVTPVGHVHVLDVGGLLQPGVTVFSARREGTLVGIGALRELDSSHAEIKSMHTARDARGRGVGRAMLDHLLLVAAQRGYRRVSLETGAKEKFAPARALYAAAGFESCPPFGDYTENPNSACMTIEISPQTTQRESTQKG